MPRPLYSHFFSLRGFFLAKEQAPLFILQRRLGLLLQERHFFGKDTLLRCFFKDRYRSSTQRFSSS
jgi:hypothetical protein